MKEVIPGVYNFTGLGMGRVYLIEDEDGFTLIDVGKFSAPARIVKQMEARGLQADRIRRILITHAHSDHAEGAPVFQALSGAQVMCSAVERPAVEGEVPVPVPKREKLPGLLRLASYVPIWYSYPPKTMRPARVDRELADRETLPEVLGGLQVLFTPGHTPGHLSFWQPERRILFCGDAFMRLPRRGLTLPYPLSTVDMQEARRSIPQLADLEPVVICFGHGDPLMENAAQKLRAFAAKEGR
ncbi:MAG TPA: MBL fold metallo-hydrolase [Ardenticatenaceae bacterium]